MTFSLPYGKRIWLLPLVAVTGVAPAQVDNSPESNTASAVGLAYRSAFENYQPYSAQQIQPWRESNDNVGKIGGWRAYAKEMNQPAGDPSPKTEAGTPTGHHQGKQ